MSASTQFCPFFIPAHPGSSRFIPVHPGSPRIISAFASGTYSRKLVVEHPARHHRQLQTRPTPRLTDLQAGGANRSAPIVRRLAKVIACTRVVRRFLALTRCATVPKVNPVEMAAPEEAGRFFQQNGFVGPYPLLSPDQTDSLERLLRIEFEKKKFSPLKAGRNRHLDLEPIASVCRHRAVTTLAASLLGPDLLLWRTQVFFQGANRALPWHYDMYASLLESPGTNISFHIAISAATDTNCVSLIPESHRRPSREFGLEPLSETTGYGNQRFVQTGDPPAEKRMILNRGEFFIFHQKLIHRTCYSPDSDSRPRIAVALRITTPDVRVRPEAFAELPSSRHGAVLLAGEDTYRLNQLGQWLR